MTWKDDNGIIRTNGSMAARLSLAAGLLLVLFACGTEERDPNNPYSQYNIFLDSYDKVWSYIQSDLFETSSFDAIGAYHSMALLALGSKDGTRRELLDALNYYKIDEIITGAAQLNTTIPTYSQFSFESYIDLSEEAELDSEFDRILTQYIPLVVKRKSVKLCKDCASTAWDKLSQTQQVCFASYSDYKADWAKQFDRNQTSQMSFNNDFGQVEEVTVMSRTGLALYKEDNDEFKMQMLTIPFANLDSFLLLTKPNYNTSIGAFTAKVRANFDKVIKNVMYQQKLTNVKMVLPKFKGTTDLDFMSGLFLEKVQKILYLHAETAILKDFPNTNIKYYKSIMEFEINEEGVNYKAKTVAGNVKCDGIPERKIPTLEKSHVQSPFAVPEIVSWVGGIANETLKPESETVIEFKGSSPFLYLVVTTDLTVLSAGIYDGK